MAIPDDVSHGDIYHKLGSLEGKLETVVIQLTERRSDIAAVFARLREVEIRVAVGVGVASQACRTGSALFSFQRAQDVKYQLNNAVVLEGRQADQLRGSRNANPKCRMRKKFHDAS